MGEQRRVPHDLIREGPRAEREFADKWEQPLSVTTNYVVTKVSFAVVKATHDTIFGARARSGLGPCPTTEADLPPN